MGVGGWEVGVEGLEGREVGVEGWRVWVKG